MFIKDKKSIMQYTLIGLVIFMIVAQAGRMMYSRIILHRTKQSYNKHRQMIESLEKNRQAVEFLQGSEDIEDYDTFLTYTLHNMPGVQIINGLDRSYGDFVIIDKRLQITCGNPQQLQQILQNLHQISSTITVIEKMSYDKHPGAIKVYIDVKFTYCKTNSKRDI